jgi:Na+/H+-translocating membrane pyrophosphatase
VALFARVGGGIYTKAADVGADLVGKYENDLPEDSPRNPATIADNVGDNVGDIAGMGADLFGSLAESTCATLVIGSELFSEFNDGANILYPLIITSLSILGCFLTSIFATDIIDVKNPSKIERTLKL